MEATVDWTPWLAVKPVTALVSAAKLAGAPQGVPVCFDWYRNVGTHGAKARHPTAMAANAFAGCCQVASPGFRRRISKIRMAIHSPVAATR